MRENVYCSHPFMNERMKQKTYQFHGICNDGFTAVRISGSPRIWHRIPKRFEAGLRGELDHLVHFRDL